MRIGYFGDGPWSHQALERIVATGRFEVAFIAPRYTTRDPILARWAERLGVEFALFENVNTAASVARLAAFKADLFVSMSYDQIFRTPVLQIPPQGVINCHAGELPWYRGRNVLNWALINDAHDIGVTVHYIDDTSIDTGDIVLQRRLPVTDEDRYATVLARASEACACLLTEALVAIADGRASRKPQQSLHPVGTYCGRRLPGDEWINWEWPSRRIFNFVRAISPPGPGARTAWNEAEFAVHAVGLIPEAPVYIGTPGEIVGFRAGAPVIKTGDSTVVLSELGDTLRHTLKIGDRLACSKAPYQIAALERRIRELELVLAKHDSVKVP